MDSAEDIVYAIIALVCSLLVGLIRVITAPDNSTELSVLKRTRTRPRPALCKHIAAEAVASHGCRVG
jgi:hypothetical protein